MKKKKYPTATSPSSQRKLGFSYDKYKRNNKKEENHLNFLKCYRLFSYFKDYTTQLKKMKTPSLILTGTKDQGSTVKMSQNLSNELINSQFIKIKNAKHLCSIEYSSNVNMIIKQYLRT